MLFEQTVFRKRAESAAGRELNEVDCTRLGVLAFLHDIGKLAPGFQAKGWPDELWRYPKVGHLTAGWQWCDDLEGRETEALNGVIPDLVQWMGKEDWISMLLAHHGRPVKRSGPVSQWPQLPHYDWQAEETRMGQALKSWFPIAFELNQNSLPTSHRFRHFFGGALALADWVGSDTRAFSYVADFNLDYWSHAQVCATTRLQEIGLDVRKRSVAIPTGFRELTGYDQPNPSQVEVGQVPLQTKLLILEAETGSGKTEAALWRYVALRAKGEVESLYFAVPTRAAAKQLHERVNTALKRVLGHTTEAVLAIPGQAKAGDVKVKLLPGWSVLWDDDENVEKPSRWAAEHATRYLAAEIAVGTVDQAMMAALMVKHAHLRGFALSRGLLVIDEVHASDTYMRWIQKELLSEHLALGGHALLMSATLGAVARAEFLGSTTIPEYEDSKEVAYPAIWVEGKKEPRTAQDAGLGKSVNVRAVEGWGGRKAAMLAIGAASRGARVLVIRNTVVYAQETFKDACELNQDLVMRVKDGPALHHSRFATEDRSLLDKQVTATLGKNADRDQGYVVIGTQTLEQSLDIDADYLVTDLCPMDVLLQRVGRLHRHPGRIRPDGFGVAQVEILYPEGGLDPLTRKAENGLGSYSNEALSGVYVDVPGLQATLQEIQKFPVWKIPRMNRALVEAATHPDALERVSEQHGWQPYFQKVFGSNLAQLGMAENVLLDRTKPLPDCYPDDKRIRTRLGAEGAVFDLPESVIGPFGNPVQRFALPAHWSMGMTGKEECVKVPAVNFVIEINGKRFSYTRFGLQLL